MLRLLMLVSGAFEALFGLSALLAPALLIGALGAESNEAAIFLTRILGAATLGIGVTALLARDHADTKGGLAVGCGRRSTTCWPPRSSSGPPQLSVLAMRCFGARACSMP
jgi:hypothetical protein